MITDINLKKMLQAMVYFLIKVYPLNSSTKTAMLCAPCMQFKMGHPVYYFMIDV